MKNGTVYAKRLKRVYAEIKSRTNVPAIGEATNPLRQLVLSVLSQETSLGNARKAFAALLDVMVDVNEVRVSSPREIADIIEPYIPKSRACAARLGVVLNAVYHSENNVRLDALHSIGKREAKHRLEELDGVEPYDVASVMLWSLGGHAIPVNAKLLAALRKDDLVDLNTPVAEVQSFLERHIPPAEARTFCLMMAGFSPRKPARAPKPAPTPRKPTRTSSAKKKTTGPKTTRRKKPAQGS